MSATAAFTTASSSPIIAATVSSGMRASSQSTDKIFSYNFFMVLFLLCGEPPRASIVVIRVRLFPFLLQGISRLTPLNDIVYVWVLMSFWLNTVKPFLSVCLGFNVISTEVRVLPERSGEIPRGKRILFVYAAFVFPSGDCHVARCAP
ncbi:MAG: hypothetical protein ACLUSP_08695 [Christensenellales bacterium]